MATIQIILDLPFPRCLPVFLLPLSSSKSTVEHVGEWKIEVRADSLEGLFAETARFVASATGPTQGSFDDWEEVTVEARDQAALLVDWANELIGRSEVNERAYSEVRDVVINPSMIAREDDSHVAAYRDGLLTLTAQVRGQPVVSWQSPLKAATYHGASVRRMGDEWRAEILFDV
jgi:SHS2 domain-containing protein